MMRKIYAPVAGAAVLALLGAALQAAPSPVMLDAIYSDELPTKLNVSKKTPICIVHAKSISDDRREKKVVGVIGQRATYAPEDGEAWLRSIIDGLKSRRIELRYETGNESSPKAVDVEFALKTAWVSNTGANVSANMVFALKAVAPSGEVIDKPYRGNNSRMPFWSAGKGEVQGAIDTATARVLDMIAIDLHKLCGNEVHD